MINRTRESKREFGRSTKIPLNSSIFSAFNERREWQIERKLRRNRGGVLLKPVFSMKFLTITPRHAFSAMHLCLPKKPTLRRLAVQLSVKMNGVLWRYLEGGPWAIMPLYQSPYELTHEKCFATEHECAVARQTLKRLVVWLKYLSDNSHDEKHCGLRSI